MSIFNQTSMMIIKEASKADVCTTDCIDNDVIVSDFEDTLAGLDTTEMNYTIDAIPILKCDEGSDSCCESYLVEFDVLYKLIESYEDIKDEYDAHASICEHYSLEKEQLAVVFENEGFAKELTSPQLESSNNYGIMRRYSNCIKNFLNKGIKCVKKN